MLVSDGPLYPDRCPLAATCLDDPGKVPSLRDLVGRDESSSSDSDSDSDSVSSPELSLLGSTANDMLKSSRSFTP